MVPMVPRQRASSITTRIKTLPGGFYVILNYAVREHLPLQQGLRRQMQRAIRNTITGQRASSITTRIKTDSACINWFKDSGQRASSITTRIKTAILPYHYPIIYCQRASSITTRIKTVAFKHLLSFRYTCQRASSITTRIKTV